MNLHACVAQVRFVTNASSVHYLFVSAVIHHGHAVIAGTICACPDLYDPVCGSDGATYPNPCNANCSGVDVIYVGPCGALHVHSVANPCA